MNVLGRKAMTDITQDMLLTEAYLNRHPQPDSVEAYYYESVLKKHGVSQAKYDSSLLWYGRNIHRLTTIYEDAQKILQASKAETDTLLLDSIQMQRIRFAPLESQWRASSRLYLPPSRTHYLYEEQMSLADIELEADSILEWGTLVTHLSDTIGLTLSLRLLIQDDLGHAFRSITAYRYEPMDSLQRSHLPVGDLRYYFQIPTDTLPPAATLRLLLFLQKPLPKSLHLQQIYLGKRRDILHPDTLQADTLHEDSLSVDEEPAHLELESSEPLDLETAHPDTLQLQQGLECLERLERIEDLSEAEDLSQAVE